MTEKVQKKIQWYHNLNKIAEKGAIVFTGSSFMQDFPIQELERNFCVEQTVYNRGIAGLTIANLKDCLSSCIFELSPSKIFLSFGEEDINTVGFTIESFIDSYLQILVAIKKQLPLVKIYVIGVLPIINGYKDVNTQLQRAVSACKCEYLDFENVLLDKNNSLKEEYISDYTAVSPSAYVAILRDLKMFFRNRMMGFGEVWNMVENWT
jgi:lysophospholipase L1-like esterase